MMDYGELLILDVGHGNCSIIKHGDTAIIIDAPGRPIISEVLEELKIKRIKAILISHADSDHLSGAIPILMNSERPVESIYVNPDKRNTDCWTEFRIAVHEARTKMSTNIITSLNSSNSTLTLNDTAVNVLFPNPEMCLATNNGTHIDGIKLNPNSMSAVISIEHLGERVCLLTADTNTHSLETMIAEDIDLKAPLLVFPHHGGHAGAGAENREFARNLVSTVQPRVVIFSIGRGLHGTPKPEIMKGAREALSHKQPYIACTQLSKHCCADAPKSTNQKINKNSDGIRKNSCCAGTIVFPLQKGGIDQLLENLTSHHQSFITSELPTPLCKRNH